MLQLSIQPSIFIHLAEVGQHFPAHSGNMVFIMDKPLLALKSNSETPLGFSSRVQFGQAPPPVLFKTKKKKQNTIWGKYLNFDFSSWLLALIHLFSLYDF